MSGAGKNLILLTGATGYVGGRLLKTLERKGLRVRCLVRRPASLQSRTGANTQIVPGDVLDADSLRAAMTSVEQAYYLVHSMAATEPFSLRDRQAAELFGETARKSGVRRIIYLGGLGSGPNLSPHLASRQEVGQVLRESGVPTIEFRASIIIGSGSLSFEMIRALVDRLPVMVTPKWVSRLAQPIAIEDVIDYLVAALDCPADTSEVFEIGGPQQASYRDIMREYARQRGLRRAMIRVPVLTPGLSSLWLGLVTPLYARVGRKLIASIRNNTVVTNPRALTAFPIRPRNLSDAIQRAMRNEDEDFARTRWSDALSSSETSPRWGGIRFGSRLIDSRTVIVSCPPAEAFAPIRRIGGDVGWYYGNLLWRIRGRFDSLIGGVGLRRGRRHREEILPGDTIDFWRVEAYESDRLLRLAAEMRVPGRAWLQFEVDPHGEGSMIRQTAIFEPVGLTGMVYWYALYPIHMAMFEGMSKRIGEAAQRDWQRHKTEARIVASGEGTA